MREKDKIKKSLRRMKVFYLFYAIFYGLGGIVMAIGVFYFLKKYGVMPPQIFTEISLYYPAIVFGPIVGICGGYVLFNQFLKKMRKEYNLSVDVLIKMEPRRSLLIIFMIICGVGHWILLPLVPCGVISLIRRSFPLHPIYWSAVLYSFVVGIFLFLTAAIRSSRAEKIIDTTCSR